MDPLYYPHPSRRMAVYASGGMVATSQPLAAQAGLEILEKGAMPSTRPSPPPPRLPLWSPPPTESAGMPSP